MTKNYIYKELKTIQRLIWKDDDLMRQETLFELQEKIAELVLNVATDCNKCDDLVKSFPFLYRLM